MSTTNSREHYSGVPTASNADWASMSMSAHSRVGSPDNLTGKNAARSQVGTLDHDGDGSLQQPVPVRGEGNAGAGVDRFDV